MQPAPIQPGGSVLVFGESDPAIMEVQVLLGKYGYSVPASGHFDGTTRDVVAAFQRHFRQEQVDGVADHSTIATIKTLLAAAARDGR